MPPPHSSDRKPRTQETRHLPVEIELFIEPDGAVVFADLAADVVPIARRLTEKRETMYESLLKALRDWLAILPLRWQVSYLKLQAYDRMQSALHESQAAAHSLERSVWRLNRQIEAQEAQIAELESRRPQVSASVRETQLAIFRSLRPIVTELPSLRAAIKEGKSISAEDVLVVLSPLDEAVEEIGFKPFGLPEDTLPFDPERHRAVGKGARSVGPGDTVRVRHSGYTYNGEVIYKAHVTRIGNE